MCTHSDALPSALHAAHASSTLRKVNIGWWVTLSRIFISRV